MSFSLPFDGACHASHAFCNRCTWVHLFCLRCFRVHLTCNPIPPGSGWQRVATVLPMCHHPFLVLTWLYLAMARGAGLVLPRSRVSAGHAQGVCLGAALCVLPRPTQELALIRSLARYHGGPQMQRGHILMLDAYAVVHRRIVTLHCHGMCGCSYRATLDVQSWVFRAKVCILNWNPQLLCIVHIEWQLVLITYPCDPS